MTFIFAAKTYILKTNLAFLFVVEDGWVILVAITSPHVLRDKMPTLFSKVRQPKIPRHQQNTDFPYPLPDFLYYLWIRHWPQKCKVAPSRALLFVPLDIFFFPGGRQGFCDIRWIIGLEQSSPLLK